MQEKTLTEKKRIDMKKEALLETACEELLSYGVWGAKDKAKNWVKKNLLRQQTAAEDLIYWPTSLLAVSLWRCRGELLAEAADEEIVLRIENSLSAYFTRWEKKKCPICYLDDLLAGEVLLAMYEEYNKNQTENGIINAANAERFKADIDKLADYAFAYPTDEIGNFPYRANQQNGHIYVDAVGLACPFLYEYGRIFHKDEGMELAVKQIANFLAYAIDAATGLPYHGYDVATGTKYGIIGWGRAVGWLLRGLTGCMTTVYGAARLREAYGNLMDAVLAWQRKDGYFSWQLQALEGPADTSATSMICASLKQGLRAKTLQGEVYENALERGTHAIQKSISNGRVHDCLGECEGFSQYPQKYGTYPWALAFALLLDR